MTRLSKPAKFSYLFMVGTFILIGALGLGGPFVAALFSFLVLSLIYKLKHIRPGFAVVIFVVLLLLVVYGLAFFAKQSVRALPEVAEKAIPSVIHLAKQHNIELPFTDYDSLKDAATETVKGQARYFGSFLRAARGAGRELLLVLVGCFVASALFVCPKFDLTNTALQRRDSLYTACGREIAARFGTLFRSFEIVMGGQLLISAINTALTAIFVFSVGLKEPVVIIGVTFLCGLVPVIGNLISNTIIAAIALTISTQMALLALVFLIMVHKLEYFLNSKIIGHRISNPVWLTLIGLVLGERLMGITGMILAPVLLHYIKVEASSLSFDSKQTETEQPAVLEDA